MTKLILEVTSSELSDLLRLPEVARFMDTGRAYIQPSSPPPLAGPSTRQRGRQLFERLATEHGLTVSTFSQPGVSDFIVQGATKSRPVQLICSESPRISLRREWKEPANLVCAYVWMMQSRARIFLMSYSEAAGVLGDKALESPSFKTNGYYTTACTPRRQQTMERFEDRWDLFNS